MQSWTASEMPDNPRWFSPPAYGMALYADLFTNRQLTALKTLSDLISEARSQVEKDSRAFGLSVEATATYSAAVATYLAFALSKLSDRHSTLTNWYFSRESTSSTFQRQAIPMLWDFAETQPLGDGTGTYVNAVEWVAEVIDPLPTSGSAIVQQADATTGSGISGAAVATDPPYYDNIAYADLADYFYIWLRRSLRDIDPDLFGTMVTPKSSELIASPYRHGGSKKDAELFFQSGFVSTFARLRTDHAVDVPMTTFYAFKQAQEGTAAEGAVSTGWATMLEGMLRAGWAVTATWPMRTEASNRMIASGTNALASSVVLACRPRPETAGVTDRQGFLRALHAEMPAPLHELQKAHIAPVDLRQAAIGPGMAVFSRFDQVIEPDGSTMGVRTALGLINQVLDQVLDEQEEEFDAETRWAIHWFSQFYADEGPYGVAEQLAVSMNVAVRKIVTSGIIESGRGKVRLLGRDELPDGWDPTTDQLTPVWEATQHLVKRLENGGESSAARLLRQLGELGASAQLLAYRLYTVCEKARPALAGPYNALVASWPEIQRLAEEATAPITSYEQQSLGS